MSFLDKFADEGINTQETGFNTALFINVPNWKNLINKDNSEKDIVSAETTPDQNKLLTEFNKSFVNNLLSKDLIKKLEEESPFKNSNCDIHEFVQNKFSSENKFSIENKFSFEDENEEDLENGDSETKASKLSKYSKDSKESIFSTDYKKKKKSSNSGLFLNADEKSFLPDCAISSNGAKSFEIKNPKILKGNFFLNFCL